MPTEVAYRRCPQKVCDREASSLQAMHCRRAHRQVLKFYEAHLKWVFRDVQIPRLTRRWKTLE
jgi:hypothetical protein